VKFFAEVDTLAARIRAACKKIPVIGIDGFCGSGTTFLARQLSQALKTDLVSTDDYAVRQGRYRRYSDRLDLAALSNSLHWTARSKRQVILEGICLLEVIARLGISTNSVCSVYVKQLSRSSGI